MNNSYIFRSFSNVHLWFLSLIEKSFFINKIYNFVPASEKTKEKSGLFPLYFLLLFIFTLIVKPYLKNVYSESTIIIDIIGFIVLFSLFLKAAFLSSKKINKTLFGAIFLAIVVVLPGLTYGYWRFSNGIGLIFEFLIWVSFFVSFIVATTFLDGKKRKNFIIGNLYIATALSAFAVIQFFYLKTGFKNIEGYEEITQRASSFLLNPNALAGYLGLTIISSVSLIKNVKKDFLILLWIGVCLLAFFITFSRGAILALIITLAFFLIKRKEKKLLLAAVLFFLALFLFFPSIQNRSLNVLNPTHILYSSENGRIWSLRNVFYISNHQKSWLTGLGLGTYGGELAYNRNSLAYYEGLQDGFKAIGNTDNQWLQVYAQQGFLSILIVVYFFLYILKKIKEEDKKHSKYSYTPLIILFFGSLSIFMDTFQSPALVYLFFILVGAGVSENKKSNILGRNVLK